MKVIFNKVETPSTIEELVLLIKLAMMQYGNNCDLNFIDVSQITDLSYLFSPDLKVKRSLPYSVSEFNGDISKWDVSNVSDMSSMFENSNFKGNISNWNVSNVINMSDMFAHSQFNGDISRWDVSNVTNMDCMFYESKFNRDISDWDVSSVDNMRCMFWGSDFQGDISNWNISKVVCRHCMFDDDFTGNRPRSIDPSKVVSNYPLPSELWLYYRDYEFIWSLNPLMNPDPSYKVGCIPLDEKMNHTVEYYAQFTNMEIKESSLSIRAKNIIESWGINMGSLILFTYLGELHKFRYMGPKFIKEIYEFLRANGILIDLEGQDRQGIF